MTKTVKYYTNCKQDYHTKAECRDKHPHLRDSKPKSTKPQTERRRAGKESDQQITDNANGSFFVQSDQRSFLSAHIELALSKIWIWDSGTSQHSSYDRSLFDNFEPLPNRSPVKRLGGQVIPLGIGSIRVSCKGKQGQLAYLNLDKVLFMPGSGVNLMSQGQLQREG